MDKFSHAGTSTQNGVTKVRYANDAMRTKVLIKNGHTNVDIIELREPMTKEDAIAYLIHIDFANKNGTVDAAVQAALEAEVDKRSDAPAKAPKVAVAKAPKAKAAVAKSAAPKVAAKAKSTVTKAQVTAQMAEIEDAPY
jgi:hypothetical protein